MSASSTRELGWRGVAFLISLLVGVLILVFILAPAASFQRDRVVERTPPDITESTGDDPEHEISMLEGLYAQHPDHTPIALQLANLYFDQGAFPLAIKYYREFLRRDTSAAGYEVALDLARALFHLDRGEEAISEVKTMLNAHPEHSGALYNLGALQANTGDYRGAKQTWQRLIDKHPADPLATFARRSLPALDLPPGHP